MSGQGPTVGPPPDRNVFTNGVEIPKLLDMLTRRYGTSGLSSSAEVLPGDPDEWPVYWMLRRYYTFFPAALVASIIEPIRAKVEAAGDLSTLTDDERAMARQINILFNTDYDQLGWVTSTTPEFSP